MLDRHAAGNEDSKEEASPGGKCAGIGEGDSAGAIETDVKESEEEEVDPMDTILVEGGQEIARERIWDSEGEGEEETAQERMEDWSNEGQETRGEKGDAGGGAGRTRQDATAVMMDKALKLYAKQIIVREEAKMYLEKRTKIVLGGLHSHEELSGSMDWKKVKKAIKNWISSEGQVGTIMRMSIY